MKKQQLSYYEKRSIVSIVVLLSVYSSMFYDAFVYYQLDNPQQGLLNFWGNQFLELFLCLIVVYLVALLAFNLINKKITGETRPKITDERDNSIELTAIHASFYTLALGVFVAMLTGMWVETYSLLFLIILSSFMASGLVADIIRIALYRKSS